MKIIYGLYDPRILPLHIRYVGYTGKGVAYRLAQHVREAINPRGVLCHRSKWIRALLAQGVAPSFKTLEFIRKGVDWQEREQYWIAKFGDQLTNSTVGGEGLVNPTADVRMRISKKVSASLLGNSRRMGIPHSDATKKKISEGVRASEKHQAASAAKRGKQLPGNATQRAAEVNRGRPKTEAHRAAIGLAQRGYPKGCGARWANDGVVEKLIPKETSLPQGFDFGRLSRC